eukprot:scaffold30730_cov31-Tisochrysis_lutea.AAC.3
MIPSHAHGLYTLIAPGAQGCEMFVRYHLWGRLSLIAGHTRKSPLTAVGRQNRMERIEID